MNTPSFITELFPDLPEVFPLDAIPEPMRGMISGLSSKFSITSEVGFAICSTAVAASLGRNFLVDPWNTRATALSNYFVLLGEPNERVTQAIEVAWRPIFLNISALLNASKQAGKALSDPLVYPADGGLATLDASQRLHRAILKPVISLRDGTAARLAEAALNSFDQSLLLLPGQDDAAHWFDLPTTDRKVLAQTLTDAWHGRPGSDSMHLNVLWRCSPENSHRFGSCKHIRENNVPFWFLLVGPPRPLTDAAAAPLKSQLTWDKFLDALYMIRVQQPPQVLKFSKEGAQHLIGFINDFNRRLELVPPEFRPYLRWLPETARRFSLMHAILRADASQLEIGPQSVDCAVRVINWMGAAHLRAIIAAIPMGHVKETHGKRQISPEQRMLEKVRLKEPVLWSTLRRSYPDSNSAPLVAIRDRLVAEGRLKWVGARLELVESPTAP